MVSPRSCPVEVGLRDGVSIRVMEMVEGHESEYFWIALEADDRSQYNSLVEGEQFQKSFPSDGGGGWRGWGEGSGWKINVLLEGRRV